MKKVAKHQQAINIRARIRRVRVVRIARFTFNIPLLPAGAAVRALETLLFAAFGRGDVWPRELIQSSSNLIKSVNERASSGADLIRHRTDRSRCRG